MKSLKKKLSKVEEVPFEAPRPRVSKPLKETVSSHFLRAIRLRHGKKKS